MRRNVWIALVLAAVAVMSAFASPARPAKARKNARATSTVAAKTKQKDPAPPAARTKAGKARRTRQAAPVAAADTNPCAVPPKRSKAQKQTPAPRKPAVPAPAAVPKQAPAVDAKVPAEQPQTAAADAPDSAVSSRRGARSARNAKFVMTPPLRGSYTSLVRQNTKVEADGLERIEDHEDLLDRISRKMLVPLPASPKLVVSSNLPPELRYCRPWTASFLADLAKAHARQFRGPINVSSAVRTVEYQKRLIQVNGNAAAAEGDIVSPHLTGATVDVAKSGLTARELSWFRSWLLPLQMAGKLDVEEEFLQACFHITVYKSYVPPAPPPRLPRHPRNAPAVTDNGSALASRGR